MVGCLVLACSRPELAQEERASEYQVKAAFLFHFAEYVDWPEKAFTDAATGFTYCTLGEDAFQGGLDETLKGKTVGRRPIRVKHLKRVPGSQECQVLFIRAAEERELARILESLHGAPVLTVGDAQNFAEDGGIIGFCVEQKKIRFEINLEAAAEAKLKISARLLRLAKTVIGDPRGS